MAVRPEIKFCGMTRRDDVEAAVALGAEYVGVIFAGGPRAVRPDVAAAILATVPGEVRRVGVFADASAVGTVLDRVRLDVVQLHGDPMTHAVDDLRKTFDGEVWAAVRVREGGLPAAASSLFRCADAVVVDSFSTTSLGGTGSPLAWDVIAPAIAEARGPARLVVAGGLRAENVARAIAALDPDVVDVSSGVESAPGIKDHSKLLAFQSTVVAARPWRP